MSIELAREIAQRWSGSLRKHVRVAVNYPKYAERKGSAQAISQSATTPEVLAADALYSDGFCRLDVEANEILPTLDICRRLIKERADTAPRRRKVFFAQLINPDDLVAYPCLLQAGLEHRVLNILTRTYGIVPFLESVELLVSFPTDQPTLLQSQLWHIDRTDSVVVKQIIYVDDVGPDQGPFALIPPQESCKVPRLIRHYLTDQEIGRYVDLSHTAYFEGQAGARALVDTGRCFHYGSRVKQRRHALFFYYNTGYGKFERQANWRNSPIGQMEWSSLQRQVLDLT